MFTLPSLACRYCSGAISGAISSVRPPVALEASDCLRRCLACDVAVSNASGSQVTYIHADPLRNIPSESHEGVLEALKNAANVRNRQSKLLRFGYSTSEDAVTWVIFTYLLRSRRLRAVLARCGFPLRDDGGESPALLLWGVPIDANARGQELAARLRQLCMDLGERSDSMSEPDVVIDSGQEGLIFIEVKYLSGNEHKEHDHHGWGKYFENSQLTWNAREVSASGCYELARNWRLLKGVAGSRPAALVNLGLPKLFEGAEGKRLDRFESALGTDEVSRFLKLHWLDLLEDEMGVAPDWFSRFCRNRFFR